jgi:hypothetical protein
MTFSATFFRGVRGVAVAGEARPDRDGKWSGTFTFADGQGVAPGAADLMVDGGGIWEVMVLSTHATREDGWHQARFRVLRGLLDVD